MAVSGRTNCDACPEDCTSVLGEWQIATCISDFCAISSEICEIYLSDIDSSGTPVGGLVDFADATAFGTAIDAAGNTWRRIKGTGSIPAPEDTTIDLSCNRTKTTNRTWTFTFTIDNVCQTNYETASVMGSCDWSGRMAYATKDVIFADSDQSGIMVDIKAVPLFNEGTGEILKIQFTITWDDLCWPKWIGDAPFTS